MIHSNPKPSGPDGRRASATDSNRPEAESHPDSGPDAALEKLWKAAYVFHAEGSLEAELWVLDRTLRNLLGDVGQVVKGIRQSITKRGLSGAAGKTLRGVADYLYRNRTRMRYAVWSVVPK